MGLGKKGGSDLWHCQSTLGHMDQTIKMSPQLPRAIALPSQVTQRSKICLARILAPMVQGTVVKQSVQYPAHNALKLIRGRFALIA